jgi:sugar phosphate permease
MACSGLFQQTLLEETGIEKAITGTAVGLISVIGYTPDVFLNSVAGRILDASSGLKGYQDFFKLLTGIAIMGLVAALVLAHENRKQKIKTENISENK